MTNGVCIETLDKRHVPSICHLFKNTYLHTEPLAVEVGEFQVVDELIEGKLDSCLKDKISAVAVENDEAVGFALCYKKLPGEAPFDSPQKEFMEYEPIFQLLRSLHDNINIWAELGCSTLYHVGELCVDPQHSRRGIARAMIERTMELAKEAGIEGCFTECSSPISRKVFEGVGFKIFNKLSRPEFCYNGRKPFAKLDDCVYLVGRKV